MKKLALLFLATLIVFNCENESVEEPQAIPPCDNGTFVGDVRLLTQQEVDEFGALCYSSIEGFFIIGDFGGENDINDLTPLSSLNKISKWLTVFAANITSLQGLQNINTTSGLSLRFCNGLVDLNGLEGLNEIIGGDQINYGLIVTDNSNLKSLTGLNNLHTINGFVQIMFNESLINFDGLDNLEKMTGEDNLGYSLEIISNSELQNLDALSSLIEIKGDIYILSGCHLPSCGNENLTNFCGLQNLFANGIYNDVHISLNAYNPTIQDIIDGNCSQ